MPALSPTMTEGNIATWKIKEGDSFSAGDVLLEIETDKAQMDVEAQDDGILAKIIQGDGSKAVQVGTRIAVTAEPGDDLSSLELPAEDAPTAKKADAPKEQPKEQSQSVPKEERHSSPPPKSSAPKTTSSAKAQTQSYPLYPSVQHLLKVNGLPKEEADKIPATGPNGRLLKGDVLAYIGQIQSSYPSELADRFKTLAHLDLSNIKVAAKKEGSSEKLTPGKETAVPAENPTVKVAVSISMDAVRDCQARVLEAVGVAIPTDTFLKRAAKLANENLPKSKQPSADELFDAILGLDKVSGRQHSRGNLVPELTTTTSSIRKTPRPVSSKPDILDILAPRKSSPLADLPPASGLPVHTLSVQVPKVDEKRGRVFVEHLKAILENQPGQLVA